MEASVARRKLISAVGSFCDSTEAYFRRWKLLWLDGSLFLPTEASVARRKLISADGSFCGPTEAYFRQRKLPRLGGSFSSAGEARVARGKLISADGSFRGSTEAYLDRRKLPSCTVHESPLRERRWHAGSRSCRRKEVSSAGAVGLRTDRGSGEGRRDQHQLPVGPTNRVHWFLD